MAAIIRKIQSKKSPGRLGGKRAPVAPVAPLPNYPSLISTLPNELLQYMFHHCACNDTSLLRIRLTCRLWYNLVASDPTLPRRIRLAKDCPCWRIMKGPLQGEHNWDYCCRSISHLAQALTQYVQTRSFELHVSFLDESIGQPPHVWNAVPWDQFQRQCVSLKVHTFTKGSTINTQTFSEHLPPLPALRSLAFLSQPIIISSLLNKLPSTDNYLGELSIQCASGPLFDPRQFRRILSRIVSFQISFSSPYPPQDFYGALLSSFKSLHSLKWVDAPRSFDAVGGLPESIEWHFTLRYLWTQDSLLSTFPLPVLYTLTTLRVDGTSYKSDTGTLVLPNLTELCLFGAWTYMLQVQAPKLEYLCLRKGVVKPSSVSIRQLTRTQLRPSRLEVEELVSGSLMEALITGPFKHITELHVWVDALGARYSYLIPFISRKPNDEPVFCPRLQCLVVSLYPPGLIRDITDFRNTIVNALRRGPEVAGMPTVRCKENNL